MNPLTDLIPAKYRKYVYAVAAAAAFVYGLWEVAGGDWKTFAISLLSALVASLAASNTSAESYDEYAELEGPDTFHDGHGGFETDHPDA